MRRDSVCRQFLDTRANLGLPLRLLHPSICCVVFICVLRVRILQRFWAI